MGVEVQGFCDKRFLPLREAFLANFHEGLEIGAALAVTHRGKPVVDLWAGSRDIQGKKPWRRNTLVQLYSTTKIMLVMCIAKLVDRGKLELDQPVCRYWPAFGQNGKDKVTLREFLTHRGGIPIFDPPVTWEDLHHWKRIADQLAAQPHRFAGENILCYHPSTYGHVLGELIRRVDGRYPNRFFRDEFARRAKADFQMGLSSRFDMRRVAELNVPPLPTEEELKSFFASEIAILVTKENMALLANDSKQEWKRLSVLSPSGNGLGNARSVARLCAILANKGRLGWRRYLSRRMVEEISREQAAGDDLYIGPIRWGLGVGLDSAHWPGPSPTAFHWGGIGGSWAVMDPKARVSLAYAPNNLFGSPEADPRQVRLNKALSEVLPPLTR